MRPTPATTSTAGRAVAPAILAGVLLAGLVGWWLRPAAHSLPDDDVHGDADLAAQVRDLTEGRPSAVAVGVVADGEVRTASIGAPLSGTYEIGSINKGITGMLYADAIERGEVEPETTLGEVFDLGDAETAGITLEQLSQHASGLPRTPGGVLGFLRGGLATLLARNPDTRSVGELIGDLRDAGTGGTTPLYSNFGFSVLGHALAERAGTEYDDLVRTRIAEPLGLSSLIVPQTPEQIGDDAVTGRDASGRVQQPWTGPAMAPAGGIRADIEDMSALTAAMLDGSAPGIAALEATADFDGDRIGAGWITSEIDGRTVVWHNGGTGGFRTWLGMDLETGVGVVLLAATSDSVDEAGERLLKEMTR